MLQIDDRRFNRLALLGLATGFALVIAAFVATIASFGANQESSRLVSHTYEVVDQLSLLNQQLERAESGRRGFLLAPNDYRIQVYRENIELAPATLERIRAIVGDNPEQSRRVRTLETLFRSELDDLKRSLALVQSGRREEAQRRFAAGSASSTIRAIRAVTDEMRAAEMKLLGERSAEVARTLSVVRWVLAATGVLLLLVGGAAFWLVRRYTIDLTRTRDRLHLLNTDLEAAVAERTTDLQRANDEIQRFAYIVSHDLRSPLVNILGFTAELEETNRALGKLIETVEQEAPQLITDDVRHTREELPEAIGFIRSSTQKMDRLINAILRISREGRRTLTPEMLPMKRVLDEIASTLEHRLVELGAQITIEEPLPDIVNDRVAIEQIFSNLMENAVKYLQPGRPGDIRVRGRTQGDRVIYEVQDNGRGIDPRDHERVFDLFRRSGSQDQPGEGIGLAHVRALAYRLGGFIDVESELGEGSTFRLNLPATYGEQGAGN
jgi:signal transduction histidine kinase